MRAGFCIVLLAVTVAARGQNTTKPEQATKPLFEVPDQAPSNKATNDRPQKYQGTSALPTTRRAGLSKSSPESGVVLDVTATIDGSDVLVLSRDGAHWTHRHWGWPKNVSLNDVAWDPKADATLPSAENLEFLIDADFSHVRVLERHGRDTIAVEHGDNDVTVYFADSPGGADDYEVKLLFPSKQSIEPKLAWAIDTPWRCKSDLSTTLVFRPDHTIQTQHWTGTWEAASENSIAVHRGLIVETFTLSSTKLSMMEEGKDSLRQIWFRKPE